MFDLVVTVPMQFWEEWIAEGDAAGDPDSGQEWAYWTNPRPPIEAGDRLYVVAHGKLRGYAPVTRLWINDNPFQKQFGICRRGGAVAVTIDEQIRGFRGWRRRWWERERERPFPEWRVP